VIHDIDDHDYNDDMLQVALRWTSSIPSGEDRMLHDVDDIDDYDDDDDDDDDDMLQAGREVH
jgi:hypothetical protein